MVQYIALLVLALASVCLAARPMLAHSNPDAGLVRHFVAFRFADNVSAALQEEVQERYFALQKLCVNQTTGLPYIVAFDGGAPNSLEGKQQNMTQYVFLLPICAMRAHPLIRAYIVTFESVDARNYFVGRPFTYPYDPYHDAFKQFVGPLLYQSTGPTDCGTGVIVIDFSVLPY